VIHAGTHKTASSYIQSRMAANVDPLARAGVVLRYPASPAAKHKPLAKALASRRWPVWRRFLRGLPAAAPVVLLSAEQFTQSLALRRCHQPLVELLEAEGFRLQVVVFLRDQPDYINARYVHSTRRLYHHQPFEAYVADQLAERRHIYDYNHLFRRLVRDSSVDCTFLPYGSGLGDPFERMMAAVGCSAPEGGWLPADPSKANLQPGCQGVWLAQAISDRLEQLGIRGRSMGNSGGVVRRIAEQQGWQDDRYCGFDVDGAAAVAAHYAKANDAFARRVWGCSWRERVPEVPMQRRQFEAPVAGPQRQQLEELVEQGLVDLAVYNRRLERVLKKSAPTMSVSSTG
jgi:hypothetical protein